MIKEVTTIREIASRTEQMIQLAEEANELAIEALKLKKETKYSTQINNDADFIEEIADVKICIDIIGDYANNIVTYNINISRNELFELLATHCCKLAKAVIKLRRTLVKEASPTPVTLEEAEAALIQSICDIKSCIDAIGYYWDSDDVNRIYKEKANRFLKRMNLI